MANNGGDLEREREREGEERERSRVSLGLLGCEGLVG